MNQKIDIFHPASGVIDLSDFPRDPVNCNRVVGWAVYRFEPWHLFGFYTGETEARAAQRRAAPTYEVAFGSCTLTGDDFIEGSSEVSA
jgi:hypothetical protein